MKKFLSLVMAAALSFSLVACSSSNGDTQSSTESTSESTQEDTSQADSESTTDDALAKIKENGKLVVATSPDYPPYEFITVVDGKETVVGFDMDIAQEIANDIGVELEILQLDFNGLLMALNSDKADMVMAGMTPTPERLEAVDFSEIYYLAQQGILVKAENADSLNTLESLAGKKVGVQKGSIQEQLAMEQLPDSSLVPLVKLPNIILDLQAGNIDAAVVELPVAEGYVNQFPELAISSATVTDETGGSAIAVKKGNQSLVDQINSTIERLESEGKIDEFVFNANELMSNTIE